MDDDDETANAFYHTFMPHASPIYVTVSFNINTNVTWIKANINQSGFYRVNYDAAMWRMLTQLMTTKHTTFSPTDRAQLIDDAFTLTW